MKKEMQLITIIATLATVNAADKPNIIYINADDLGVMDVGFMGDTRYSTPNLNRLASEGMVFTNAYAPAANCAPSRAACLSGQMASRTGVYTVGNSDRGNVKTRKLVPTENTLHLSNDNRTIADALKSGGYITCQIGKWHVGKDPLEQGIEINIAGYDRGSPKSYFSPYKNPHLPDGHKGEYLTDRLTDEAITFVSDHKDKTFFLYLPYYTVHTPLQGRKDLVEKYKNKPGINANFGAMVEALDENVGRLLAHLIKTGLDENTLVLFTSDNGGIRKISKQDPLRAGKGSYYEGGVREPLVVRWPGKVAAGSKCDVPVIGLDFYPTLLEVAGIKKLDEKLLDGVSIMPLLMGSGTIGKRALFWHFPVYLQAYAGVEDGSRDPLFRTRPGSSMRLGKWKLHEYFEDGAFELYNLEEDEGETKNLASSMPEKVEELKKMLYAWRTENNCPVPSELNPKYDPNYKPKPKKRRGRK